ncbi:tetraspanin-13-like isoform X2 [Ruditapes philippinarum]|uniref:tetraspanin-13-like isoform X2 n=1 Tax=Ruditapes philippinarum TaxID=129788 RepID=UPI00295AF443|nr:tetraspanin-13-like isoform X2 [Ruditapes philippinarum]
MVCGGFSCSKNALIILNVLYIIISIILIGVAAYSRLAAIVVSLGLIGGIIACGVFLFFISLVGMIGAVKHHQVLLFFYMIILFLLFLLQFSLGCACLAVNRDQEISLVRNGWKAADMTFKDTIQNKLICCGFEDVNLNKTDPLGHPSCDAVSCCIGNVDSPCCNAEINSNVTDKKCPCATCLEKFKPRIHDAFSITGGIGLFFSFTEIIGVWVTIRYRNQKDPRANPSSFL